MPCHAMGECSVNTKRAAPWVVISDQYTVMHADVQEPSEMLDESAELVG
jgi:hypothetical protein